MLAQVIVMAYFAITVVATIAAPVFLGWWSIPIIPVLIGLAGTYIWYSKVVIGEDRLAGKLSLGKWNKDLEPGLHFVWLFLETLVEVSTNAVEKDIPDSPEKIYYGDPNMPSADGTPGPGIVPEGMTPALRVNTAKQVAPIVDGKPVPIEVRSTRRNERGGPLTPGDKGLLLGVIQPDDSLLEPQTVEYMASYGFEVRNLRQFFKKVGSIPKAKRNMDDHVKSALSGRFQRYCLAELKLRKDDIEAEVKEDLVTYCQEWGIEVTIFRSMPFGFSHEYNKSVSAAASSIEKAREIRRISESTRDELTNEGIGRANAERSMLDARTDGFRNMAEIAKTPEGRFMMANDAAREIAKASTVIVPSGDFFGSVLGVANVMQRNFQQSSSSTPAAEPVAPTAPSLTPKVLGGEKKEPKPSAEPTSPINSRPRGKKKTWKDRNQ